MNIWEVLTLVIEVNALVVIVLLIAEEREPSATMAWVLALLLFPGVGMIAYLLFGVNWRLIGRLDRKLRTAHDMALEAVQPLYERYDNDSVIALSEQPRLAGRLAAAITRQCDSKMLPCEDLDIFTSGRAKFEQLFADIAQARESVHLQYFIWENDELTARLCELLTAKMAEGVEVRILYDWAGSFFHQKVQLRDLTARGAMVCADMPRIERLNYRDHRKVAVIDGRIGYTGGMNAGQEYIDGGKRFATWRDTHCRFTGPLVGELQRLFAMRWFRLRRENLFGQRYFPRLELTGGRVVWGQLAYSGPESQWMAVRNAFLLAITGAEERVRIQSPYFVPDEAIMEALVSQSLAGVDVSFMMTGIPDKRVAWYAAFSYIDEFVAAGGRMLHYMSGFFHPKALTIDGRIAVLGTTNFDIRSFALHDELSLFFYDATTAREIDDIFDTDERECRDVTLADYEKMGVFRRFRNSFLRLWSRLL